MVSSIMNAEDRDGFDNASALNDKVTILADWVRESQNLTCFTGPGIVSREDQDAIKALEKQATTNARRSKVSVIQVRPNTAHLALVKLQEAGHLKHVVSLNHDGLHRKSGIEPSRLLELNGNTNIERCMRCGREYIREYRARTAT